MSDMVKELRKRVEAKVDSVRDVIGNGSTAERMALWVVHQAEEIERELEERTMATAEAAEETGWHPETLQDRARARLAGDDMPPGWENLTVQRTPAGYLFEVGTIPCKTEAAA